MASTEPPNYGTHMNAERDMETCRSCPPHAALNSVILTGGLLVADVVGAGILGLPVAVSKIGWLPGSLLIIALLAMNIHIALLMWRLRMYFPNVRSYKDMVSMAFSNAPEGQRNFVVLVGTIGQHSFLFAVMGIYILSSGRALGNMFHDFYVCLPTWALIACCIIIPFHATARKMGTWQSLIWLNVATIVGTCFIPLLYMASQGAAVTRAPGSSFVAVADFNFRHVLGAISTFSFSLTSQFLAIEIMSEMKTPGEFPRSYMCIAAPFQAVAFLLVGVGGYYFIGDKVTGMIGDNIPFGLFFRLAAICLFSHMIVTYLIKGIVFVRAAHDFMSQKSTEQDESYSAWQMWGVLVAIVAVLAWLVANTIPFFNELVDLVGSTVTPICCYIVPIASYVRWARDFPQKEHSISKVEGIILALEIILAIILLVFGTYFASQRIIESWETFGPPFACHCQGMWNTCQCSASHAGMLDQCPAPVKLFLQAHDAMDANFAWLVGRRAVN